MGVLSDAIAGALIAGVVSLVGILVTHQAKISDFRQQWIDSLREDVVTLVTQAIEIHSAKSVDEVSGSFEKINEVSTRIDLRLNPEENESQALKTAMQNLRQAIHSKSTFAQVATFGDEVVAAAQSVLKKEWKRVKTGEPFYKWTFRAIFWGVVLLALACIIHWRDSIWHSLIR